MGNNNKEKFGNANSNNPNWIRLQQEVRNHRAQYPDEEPIWPKPQDFAETYGFKAFETSEFRHRYNKAKDEIIGKFNHVYLITFSF